MDYPQGLCRTGGPGSLTRTHEAGPGGHEWKFTIATCSSGRGGIDARVWERSRGGGVGLGGCSQAKRPQWGCGELGGGWATSGQEGTECAAPSPGTPLACTRLPAVDPHKVSSSLNFSALLLYPLGSRCCRPCSVARPPRPPAPLPDAIPVRPVSLLLSGSRAVVQQGPAGGAPLPLRPLGPVGAARVGDEWLLGRVQGPRWPFSSSSPHGTPSASQYPTPNPENVTGVPRTALGEIRSANGRRGSCTCGRCRDRIRRLGGADSRHGGRGLVFLGWGDSWWSLRMPQGLLTGSEVHPAQAKREKESQRWPRQCMLK